MNASGISQSFEFLPGRPLLSFEAAFLSNTATTPGANDFMSVDVSDGLNTFNLYYADAQSSAFPSLSSIHRLPMTEVARVVANLGTLFPTTAAGTLLTISIQVGNDGADADPSLGYVDGFMLSAPASATLANGSGVNRLLLSPPPPVIGEMWLPTVDTRPYGTGFNVLFIYAAASPGINISQGELLVDLMSSQLFLASASNGGLVQYALPTPPNLALVGLTGTAQGYVTGGGAAELTNAATLTLGTGVAAATPSVSYGWAPASGPAPLTVSFTDTSAGEVSSWSWDFGDGTTSSAPNPTHTYTLPGVYDVRLFVEGPGGFDARYEFGAVTVVE